MDPKSWSWVAGDPRNMEKVLWKLYPPYLSPWLVITRVIGDYTHVNVETGGRKVENYTSRGKGNHGGFKVQELLDNCIKE